MAALALPLPSFVHEAHYTESSEAHEESLAYCLGRFLSRATSGVPPYRRCPTRSQPALGAFRACGGRGGVLHLVRSTWQVHVKRGARHLRLPTRDAVTGLQRVFVSHGGYVVFVDNQQCTLPPNECANAGSWRWVHRAPPKRRLHVVCRWYRRARRPDIAPCLFEQRPGTGNCQVIYDR